MAPMKILISGAGIAGNALAFWLSNLGHDITVLERFPKLRTSGLQVDLRGHGIEVMKRMGLEQDYRSKSVPEQGLQIVDSSGRRWAYFPSNKSGEGIQNFTSDFEIMRGDLCRLLHDATITKCRTKYVFGAWIESYEEKESSVEVHFVDGKTDSFDLVVGADGQNSRTRKMMLGTDTPDAFVPLDDLYVAYFTIPRPMQEGERYIATSYTATGGRGIMTRRQNPDKIQVYLGSNTTNRLKNTRPGDIKQQKEALAEIYEGAGWQAEDILKSMKDSDDFYCERIGLVKLKSWSLGRITLVGDAAYCPSVNTGMGTTSGMVGAYILAGEIGRHCGDNTKDGLATALEAYQQKFQPFMDQVQKGVVENTNKLPSTAFGIILLNCLLGAASLFRVNIAKYIIKEEVKEWDLPTYEEILRDGNLKT